jgi:cobalt-zinc-cadmium efflux system outer membrane protein
MPKKAVPLILLWSVLLQPISAEEKILSIQEAVTTALQHNPEILAAQKNLLISQGKTLQAEALSVPSVVFSNEGMSFRKKADGQGETELSLGVEQFLEFPGKRALRGTIGRFSEGQASLELDRIRMLVRARVKKAYYRVVLFRRTLESLENASSLLDQFIENILVKYRTGGASYSDVLRAKVEKARLRNQIIAEQKEAVTARAELNLLLGRKGDESMLLTTDIAYLPLDKDLPTLKDEARTTSPTLNIVASRRRQSESALKLAFKSRLPDFLVGLYFPSLRTGAWGFSVGISVPLWRTKQRGEIMEAEAVREIALISVEKEERRIMARLETAYSSVRAAEEQVKIFEQQLLKEVEDELKLGISHYQYGKIEFFNLLDLYRTFAAVRLEHLKSLYLYLVSLADLEVAGEEYAD